MSSGSLSEEALIFRRKVKLVYTGKTDVSSQFKKYRVSVVKFITGPVNDQYFNSAAPINVDIRQVSTSKIILFYYSMLPNFLVVSDTSKNLAFVKDLDANKIANLLDNYYIRPYWNIVSYDSIYGKEDYRKGYLTRLPSTFKIDTSLISDFNIYIKPVSFGYVNYDSVVRSNIFNKLDYYTISLREYYALRSYVKGVSNETSMNDHMDSVYVLCDARFSMVSTLYYSQSYNVVLYNQLFKFYYGRGPNGLNDLRKEHALYVLNHRAGNRLLSKSIRKVRSKAQIIDGKIYLGNMVVNPSGHLLSKFMNSHVSIINIKAYMILILCNMLRHIGKFDEIVFDFDLLTCDGYIKSGIPITRSRFNDEYDSCYAKYAYTEVLDELGTNVLWHTYDEYVIAAETYPAICKALKLKINTKLLRYVITFLSKYQKFFG